jgi:hypothetical protein
MHDGVVQSVAAGTGLRTYHSLRDLDFRSVRYLFFHNLAGNVATEVCGVLPIPEKSIAMPPIDTPPAGRAQFISGRAPTPYEQIPEIFCRRMHLLPEVGRAILRVGGKSISQHRSRSRVEGGDFGLRCSTHGELIVRSSGK